MKILKQLSKYFIIFTLNCFFINTAISNEPVDIWSIEKTEDVIQKKLTNDDKENISEEAVQEIEAGNKKENILFLNKMKSIFKNV